MFPKSSSSQKAAVKRDAISGSSEYVAGRMVTFWVAEELDTGMGLGSDIVRNDGDRRFLEPIHDELSV